MKILKINSQSRRDFWADMVCEHCGHIEKDVSGYDDVNFHRNVIPDMECGDCKKTSPETYKPIATKYPSDAII